MNSNHKKALPIGLLLAGILLINAGFLSFNAFRFFGFFDPGNLMDGSWRIFRGQKPYLDFILYFGPLHFDMNALFFHLFGFGKFAFLAHMVAASSLVIFATYWVGRKEVPFLFRVLATALSMVVFYWPYSHPWYDQSAHLWGILAVAALACRLPFKGSGTAFWTGCFCGMMAVAAVMAKTNVGGFYAMLFLGVLVVSPMRFWGITGMIAGSAAALVLVRIFFIPSLKMYFDQVVFSCDLTQVQRVKRLWTQPNIWFWNYYWVIAAAVAVGAGRALRSHLELAALFLGLWFTGIASSVTGTVPFGLYVPPAPNACSFGMYAAVGLLLFYRTRPSSVMSGQKKLRTISGLLIAAVIVHLTFYYAKFSYDLQFWEGLQSEAAGDYALKTKSVEGWRAHAREGQTLDAIVEYVQKNIPNEQPILILTDLQMVNALAGRDSIRGMPLVFYTRHSPTPGKQVTLFQKKFREDPPLWILVDRGTGLHDRHILNYLGIVDDIKSSYKVVQEWNGEYVLLRRFRPKMMA